MAFDIVNDLAVPPRERSRKYNIDELEVGQALIIPNGQKHTASAIYSGARSLGIKVSIRKLDNGDVGVWRTA